MYSTQKWKALSLLNCRECAFHTETTNPFFIFSNESTNILFSFSFYFFAVLPLYHLGTALIVTTSVSSICFS